MKTAERARGGLLRWGGTLLVLAMALLPQACGGAAAGGKLHPLVLIPGDGGNQLEARITKDYKPSSLLCKWWTRQPAAEGGGGWFRLWFDPLVVLSPFTRCFAERIALRYLPELDDYRNVPGVETRVPHFGSTLALRYLDPNLRHLTEYMGTLVKSFEEEMGYEEGKSLFGAPYDFRYGLAAEGRPCKVGEGYLRDLRELIENATAANAGRPAILVAHSLGTLFMLQLLARNPPEWRRQYVKHLVALAPPWGGAVVLMLTFASGSTLGVPVVDPLLLRAEQRSSESNMWLLPAPRVFKSQPLVVTPERNYSAMDMVEFLEDIGYGDGVLPYQSRVLPLVAELPAMEVPVTCVLGTGVKTPEMLVYGEGGFDAQPEVLYGDGDGTVNLASLLALEAEWSGKTSQPVKLLTVPGVSHSDVLKDPSAVGEIIREIAAINSMALASSTSSSADPHTLSL